MARVLSTATVALLLIALVMGVSANNNPFKSLRRIEQSAKHMHSTIKASARRFGAKVQVPGYGSIALSQYGFSSFGSFSLGSDSGESAACIAATAQVEVEAVNKCGPLEELSEVFDVTTNETDVNLDKVCSSDCQTFLLGLQARFPDCVTSDIELTYKMINSMCQKDDNGQYCAVSLKNVQKLDCSDYYSQSTCAGSTTQECRWVVDYSSYYYTTGHCESAPSNRTLSEVCTTCLSRFVLLMGQLDNDDQSTYQNYMNLVCSKQGDLFCYPLYNSLDSRVFTVSYTNTMNLSDVQHNVTNICQNDNARRCMATAAAATVAQMRQSNNQEYSSCMQYAYYTSISYCVQQWLSGDRAAAAVQGNADLLCSVNDNNDLCLPLLHNISRSPTIANLSMGQRCVNQSAADLTRMMNDAGCCIDKLNRDQNTDYDPAQLPPTTTKVPSGYIPNVTVASWSTNPFAYVINRCSINPSFNATAVTAAASLTCKGMTAPPAQREVRLIGVLWSVIKASPSLQAKLVAACVSDISAAIGVTAASINCSVVEDATQSLSNTSASTRRAGGQSGTKYQLTISGSNDADAASNAKAFDTLQASNSLVVPSTANTISTDCSKCLATGVSSTNLYAGLTGGDTSGTQPPVTSSSYSSAKALSTLLAMVVAIVVSLL